MGLSYFGWDEKPTDIDLANVKMKHDLTPKRFCMKTSHQHCLVRNTYGDNYGAFYFPFKESIVPIFESETGMNTHPFRDGKLWCPLKTEADYEKANSFKNKFGQAVFLRDNLDLSVALSEHMIDDEDHTEIGDLEFKAKFRDCKDSESKLVELCVNFIESTPKYQDVKAITAVPSSTLGKSNVPTRIAHEVAKKLGITSLCDNMNWDKDKVGLKTLTFDEKWPLLKSTGFSIKEGFKEKKIILLDDLYQSGVTLQFVGMKLKEVGCEKVYGLSIVKARRDTDNS